MFTAALVTRTKEEATQISTDGRTDKQNVSYVITAKYFSDVKRKEILTPATTRMNLAE